MYDVWREDQQIKTIKVSPASRPQYYIMKGKRLLLQHQFSNPLRENEDKCRKCGGKDDVCQANYDGGHHQAQSHLDNLKTYSDHSPPPGWTQNTLDEVWRSIPGTLGVGWELVGLLELHHLSLMVRSDDVRSDLVAENHRSPDSYSSALLSVSPLSLSHVNNRISQQL